MRLQRLHGQPGGTRDETNATDGLALAFEGFGQLPFRSRIEDAQLITGLDVAQRAQNGAFDFEPRIWCAGMIDVAQLERQRLGVFLFAASQCPPACSALRWPKPQFADCFTRAPGAPRDKSQAEAVVNDLVRRPPVGRGILPRRANEI